MKRSFILAFALVVLLSGSVISHGALWNRGGGLIYDDVLNVTWLQDANLAETNNFGVEGIDAQGRMSWDTANAWIAAMNAANYLGFDDWRLPHILPVNGITYNYEFSFIGLTDYGWNVSAPGSAYEGSTGSEMAYMYYNNLLNLGYYDVYGNSPQEGCCLVNTTPFIGIGVGYHWSGTVHGLWPPNVMTFDFYGGGQFYNGPGEYFFVWPVRDGDVVCAVTVDIKPGAYPNTINLKSAGVVPVAILSSSVFDATQVDPATVSLAGAKVKLIGKGDKYSCSGQDVNGDRLVDLLCHVVTAQFMIEPGSSVAVMEATTFGGKAIRGEDSIEIVP